VNSRSHDGCATVEHENPSHNQGRGGGSTFLKRGEGPRRGAWKNRFPFIDAPKGPSLEII